MKSFQKTFRPPPSRKQIEFLKDLEIKTGERYKSAPKTASAASKRIDFLLNKWKRPSLF